METCEHDAAVTGEEVSTHATTPGAALAGAVTAGVIGLSCGPVGAALGAAGGAIVGALSERLLHGGEDEQGALHAAFLRGLPVRPVRLGHVYAPTFGDDTRNFLGVEPVLARRNQRRLMTVHAELGARYGRLAGLHARFLRGDPSWFVRTIEPSLTGASEVRRAFLEALRL